MNENEWISVKDYLPPIGKMVEIKLDNSTKARGVFKYCTKYGLRLKDCDGSGNWDLNIVIEWRPIPEKRPDFSKLREGDIIVLEYITHKKDVNRIYPIKIHSMNERVIFSETSGNFLFTGIKKITRINIEEKTFEEI